MYVHTPYGHIYMSMRIRYKRSLLSLSPLKLSKSLREIECAVLYTRGRSFHDVPCWYPENAPLQVTISQTPIPDVEGANNRLLIDLYSPQLRQQIDSFAQA